MSYVDFESSSSSVATARSAEEIVKATENKNPLALIIEEPRRNPASIEVPMKNSIKADIFCHNKSKARFKKVSQSLVMLDLNLCEALKSNRHIWVKNATNGFKAQVFVTSEKNFRTDFIQLNPGNNKVLIESVLKDGQKRTQSLEIISGS